MKKDLCLNKRGKVVSKKTLLAGKKNFSRIQGWLKATKLARTYWICCLQERNRVLQAFEEDLLQVKNPFEQLTSKNFVTCSFDLNVNHVVITTTLKFK